MPLSDKEVSVEEDEIDDDNKKKKESKGNRFLIPFVSKAKKRIVSKIRRKPLSPSPSSSSCGFWKKVCFCGTESSNTPVWSCSSTSDLKDENFTSENFRVLLQRNDFFSKDCNPHL